mgnify:CR=1 FL=1
MPSTRNFTDVALVADAVAGEGELGERGVHGQRVRQRRRAGRAHVVRGQVEPGKSQRAALPLGTAKF